MWSILHHFGLTLTQYAVPRPWIAEPKSRRVSPVAMRRSPIRPLQIAEFAIRSSFPGKQTNRGIHRAALAQRLLYAAKHPASGRSSMREDVLELPAIASLR